MGYTNVILSQPQSANWLSLKTMIGHRVVIFGTKSIQEEPDTLNGGTRLVATIDMVDLDDGRGGAIQWGVKVDKVGVVNKLSTDQTTAVMGRIEYGDAKAGQSAPFLLAEHQPGDAEYFTSVWFPANKDALAGRGTPQPVTPPPPAPAPQAQSAAPGAWVASGQPAVAPPAVPPVAPYTPPAPAPAAPAPAAPAPAAAAAAQYSPEALAAFQQMLASGQIQLPPQQ